MIFLRRHAAALVIGLFGLLVVFLLTHFLEPFQVGLGPEFLLKVFAKLVYVGAALMVTHFVVKKLFPTIYVYCYTKAGTQQSPFMVDWMNYKREAPFNQKLTIAVGVHVGVFMSVCVLLALAF